MRYRVWTEAEEDFLAGHASDMTVKELAKALYRDESSVRDKLRRMCLKPKREKTRYQGCDFDCFRCPYPDCLAPAEKCEQGLYDGMKSEGRRSI